MISTKDADATNRNTYYCAWFSFLQNLEAYLVLDRITKRIAQEKPDAPLYTIHDSIATTEDHVELVRSSLNEGLTEFFGISPKIETEHWGGYSSEAA